MAKYRNDPPQLADRLFLTDGGVETTLIYQRGFELPHFAAFVLLETPEGRLALSDYFETYMRLAQRHGVGLVLESPTWRASPDFGARLGYRPAALRQVNRAAIDLIGTLRDRLEQPQTPVVISGCIGPRHEAGSAESFVAEAARDYHGAQVSAFADSQADLVSAMTLTSSAEAIGIAQAAQDHAMPCVISFTVETDGRLATGEALGEAIAAVDAATAGGPLYYMINCAHPVHFGQALDPAAAWAGRLRGVRANASRLSHAELDAADSLDAGDPADYAHEHAVLVRGSPRLTVLGGCCGTDHRHIESLCLAVQAARA